MDADPLEQLAQLQVPPVPPQLDEALHQRLNRALVARQLLDLALGALPYAAMVLISGVAHLVDLTFTGNANRRS